MKLKFFLQVLLSCGLFALALPACSDSAPRSRTELVEKMTETLELVTDTASADAAAKDYAELQNSVAALPEITKEDFGKAQIAVGNLLGQIHRLEKNNFYDSEALKTALNLK